MNNPVEPSNHVTKLELEKWVKMELPSDDIKRIEEHLEQCATCIHQIDYDELIGDHPVIQFLNGTNLNGTNQDDDFHSLTTSSPASPDSTEPQLRREDKFHRLELRGEGGVGQIWKCLDERLDRIVALKALKEQHANSIHAANRLRREATITGQLQHPGIVPVYYLNDDSEDLFYTMRLIEGENLSHLIRQFHDAHRETPNNSTADLLRLLRYFVAICNTIAYAHSKSVIHRDVKSENVVIGDFDEVVLLDWGLAKRLNEDIELTPADKLDEVLPFSSNRTSFGQRLGTPAFMSPEQARGDNDSIGFASDIWGLSAMLYEILCGCPPFAGDSADATMEKVISAPITPCREHNPTVPPELERICLSGLVKEPDKRVSSARRLGQLTNRWLTDQVERKRSYEERQNFFNLSTEMLTILDKQYGIREANSGWMQTLGWSLEELQATSYLELVHPEDQPKIEQWLDRAREGIPASDIQLRFRNKRGNFIWTSWSVNPYGENHEVYMVGRDISERKKAANRMNRLFDAAPDAMIVIDKNSIIQNVNQQTVHLFGYAKDELVGGRLERLVPPSIREKHEQLVQTYFKNPTDRPMGELLNLFGLHRSGEEFPVQVTLSPVVVTDDETLVSCSIRKRTIDSETK